MRKLGIIVVLIVVVLSMGWGQDAQKNDTGKTLHDTWIEYQKSNPPGNQFAVGFYMGFVLGVSRVLFEPFEVVSFPEGVSNAQILAVVGKYLDEHPEKWNEESEMLVFDALAEAWPNEKGIERMDKYLK